VALTTTSLGVVVALLASLGQTSGDAVLAGAEPLPRQLAPVLGLHAADLFLFAARAVPDDLAPARRG
jgi:hypothetical protein